MPQVRYIAGGVNASRELTSDEARDLTATMHAVAAIRARVDMDTNGSGVAVKCRLPQNKSVSLDLLALRPTVDFDWMSQVYVASTHEHAQRQLAFTGCPWIGGYVASLMGAPQSVERVARLEPVDDARSVQRVTTAVPAVAESSHANPIGIALDTSDDDSDTNLIGIAVDSGNDGNMSDGYLAASAVAVPVPTPSKPPP